ncbi:MAG: HAMP domain-containing histidine kinase, partial [Acidobacteria bacterium]|nr:HAMP domain-containing histidine kinase [Acidobacteriota bacterium]
VLNSASIAGELDFIFTFSQDKLMVFTKDLSKKVFTFEFKGTNPEKANLEDSIFIPLRTKRGNYALVIYDKLYMLQFSRLTFKDIFRRALKSGWPFILITLLVFNSYWVYMLYSLDIITKTHHKKKTRMDVSQFLDIARGIAHQVKNPLSTILWTAEKIKRSVAGQQDNTCIETAVDTAGFAQLAEFLMEDVKILKQQTNNLLKLIQIYKPSIREVNLKPLLQGLVTHYRSLVSEEINILLEMDDEITLCIDDQLIKEALLNLVDNAVDAMPAGGQLRISVVPVTSPAQGSVGEILIEVEDTGCGMDEEGLAKLFTPFFTKKEKGTGLGLIICKRIIESHGGIINVHSRKDFGTKIAITIPVKTAKGGTL